MNTSPPAPAILKPSRGCYLWILSRCPLCGKKHQHGGGTAALVATMAEAAMSGITLYGATLTARLAAAERRALGHYTARALTASRVGPLEEEDWGVLDRVEALVAREEGRVGYTRRPRRRERGCR